MKTAHGRRAVALLLCAAMLFALALSGCGAGGELSRLTRMVKVVQADIVPELNTLIAWQVTTVEEMLRLKAEYAARGEIYTAPQYDEEIAEYKQMCEGFLEDIGEYKEKAEKLGGLPDATYAAGVEYFTRMEESVESLVAIMVFDKAVEEATAPVTEFSKRSFTDEWSQVSALYEALNTTVSNLKTVSCPSFMEQLFQRYTDTCQLYVVFIEQWVNAISMGDNLRYAAANNMYQRTLLYEDRYGVALTKDFSLQYEKTGERLNGSIKTLAEELLDTEKLKKSELEEFAFSYQKSSYSVDISFDAAEKIYPSMYGSMDSILNFTAASDGGDLDILVETEIPGFTQKYSQTFTITPQLTKFFIKPPLMTDELNISSAKDAQITFSVTTAKGGDVLAKHSVPVRIMSKYDIEYWNDEFGMVTKDNFLCFLTPEATAVVELKREAIDCLDDITEGAMNSFPGYQNALGMQQGEEYYNTYYQIVGLQLAMSRHGVRYNMSPFSASGTEYLQRVLLPEDVLATNSGLCVETSLVMASAIQSANMHAMLVFPSGHAQVAVETWQNSGEYFLVETTILPFGSAQLDSLITYYTADEWAQYIAYGTDGYGCYILDCDHAKRLGLSAISN